MISLQQGMADLKREIEVDIAMKDSAAQLRNELQRVNNGRAAEIESLISNMQKEVENAKNETTEIQRSFDALRHHIELVIVPETVMTNLRSRLENSKRETDAIRTGITDLQHDLHNTRWDFPSHVEKDSRNCRSISSRRNHGCRATKYQ
jgi:predicted  nucleic acid-binding Zn-ribbon protein